MRVRPSPGRWPRRRRRVRVVLAAAASASLAVLVAGCGGAAPAGVASISTTSAPSGSRSAPAQGSAASGGSLVHYSTCMRAHGVSGFPDPASFASDGTKAAKGQIFRLTQSEGSSPIFRAAQRACAADYGPPALLHPQVRPAEMRKLLAVSHCMRAHGVPNFPDPDPRTGELATPPGISRSSPQVLAALRACRSLGRAAGLGPPNTGQ